MKPQTQELKCELCYHWEIGDKKHPAQCAVFTEIWERGDCPAYIHKQDNDKITKLEQAICSYSEKQKEI